MDKIKELLKIVPHLPGSYQMKNDKGVVIYVGKAKDLNKRLHSYFNGRVTGKTKIMVSEIDTFEYIVTNSEVEAFLTEINLIKHYDPKYNILLRDDKTYPYIEYINKPFPKLKVSRYLNVKKSDKKYLFGPYPNAYAARRIVKLLNRLYPFKKCEGMPNKVCLYYHIGECLGYCQKNIDQNKLNIMETEVLSFLKGNTDVIINKIKEKINIASDNLNFELAKELKEELEYIDVIKEKQLIVLNDYVNRDVIGIYYSNNQVAINILFIRNGKLLESHNKIIDIISNLDDDLTSYLAYFYKNHEVPKEILLHKTFEGLDAISDMYNVNFIIPEKGKKKELVNLASNNAKEYFDREIKLIDNKNRRTIDVNNELGKLLNIPNLSRIELFDNAHLFGTFTVSGMVVFINGEPCKNAYRKYKSTEDINDDYHVMKEVIYRRYYHALVDQENLTDLILVDGGLTQINATKDVLASLNLSDKIKLCGLKKDKHHKTSALIDGDTLEEIPIEKNSDLFNFLTFMQDEVHRFTITYHRQIRSKGFISSFLDDIEGIGEKRKKDLLRKFGSMQKLKGANLEEIKEVLPENIATILYDKLNEKKKEK
ncbi:MAG: excinuclease ABC subunit UvrC [Bacilli bacterium]|nr:excinuclease ABC subunit UvrC [Bacilli bacterium]